MWKKTSKTVFTDIARIFYSPAHNPKEQIVINWSVTWLVESKLTRMPPCKASSVHGQLCSQSSSGIRTDWSKASVRKFPTWSMGNRKLGCKAPGDLTACLVRRGQPWNRVHTRNTELTQQWYLCIYVSLNKILYIMLYICILYIMYT